MIHPNNILGSHFKCLHSEYDPLEFLDKRQINSIGKAGREDLHSRGIWEGCQKNAYQFRQATRLLKDEHMTCPFHCL